eukprot:GEMP01027393.1.p1 GENE.GEMP01027393.1~~GEMP01027393.1.p1  ORF type:complete len:533 (+),score=89.26 GEMP01027393.1:348-1946(+)
MWRCGVAVISFCTLRCVVDASLEDTAAHAGARAEFGSLAEIAPDVDVDADTTAADAQRRKLAQNNYLLMKCRLSTLHTMKIGLVMDRAFVNYSCGTGCRRVADNRKKARQLLVDMLAFASVPFEIQFNIGFIPVIVTDDGVGGDANGVKRHMPWMNRGGSEKCVTGPDGKKRKAPKLEINDMQSWFKKFAPRDAAAWVYMTGCQTNKMGGIGGEGTLGWKTKADGYDRVSVAAVIARSLRHGQKTLCHEIGHLFGADHPFGRNAPKNYSGENKGVMDYSTTNYKGLYQFNDKDEGQMCPIVQDLLARSGRKSHLLPYDVVWVNPDPKPNPKPNPNPNSSPSPDPNPDPTGCLSSRANNILRCMDGGKCNILRQGWACCKKRGGRERCPANHPYMCKSKSKSCDGDHCCAPDPSGCSDDGGLLDRGACPTKARIARSFTATAAEEGGLPAGAILAIVFAVSGVAACIIIFFIVYKKRNQARTDYNLDVVTIPTAEQIREENQARRPKTLQDPTRKLQTARITRKSDKIDGLRE